MKHTCKSSSWSGHKAHFQHSTESRGVAVLYLLCKDQLLLDIHTNGVVDGDALLEGIEDIDAHIATESDSNNKGYQE